MKVILISGKSQHGKDLSASIIKRVIENDGKKVLVIHYADLLKYICKTFFEWNGDKDIAGRSMLQRVGTDVIRKKEPDYWVDFIIKFLHIFNNEWDYVIIPDCRFPNEIDKTKNNFDAFSLRVNRIDFESNLTELQKQHESETALDEYKFDYTINTENGLDILKEHVIKMYEMELK